MKRLFPWREERRAVTGTLFEPMAPSDSHSLPGSIGAVLLAAGIAVQAFMDTIFLAGQPARDAGLLSRFGSVMVWPEREVPTYLAFVAAGLLLAAAAGQVWKRKADQSTPGSVKHFVGSPIVQGAVAVSATLVCLMIIARERNSTAGPQSGQIAVLGSLFLMTLAMFACALVLTPRAGAGQTSAGGAGPDAADVPRLRLSVWDLVVPLVIVALIYVPKWHLVSGRLFLEENNFHWDLFSAWAALKVGHGEALGTELHAYYGAGWPLVYAALSRWFPVTYGRMIQIGSVYLCIYLSGVYLFFRVLLRRPGRAAIGTALVLLPLFFWQYGLSPWRAPNVTPLRWPFDIWCFLALALHARTPRRVWAAVAGACVGLAIVFNINGGRELAVASILYFAGACFIAPRRSARRDLVLWWSTAAVVAAAGLALAGRGRVFSGRFWSGWISEPLGFVSVPLLSSTAQATLLWFGALVFFYLSVAGRTVARAACGKACPLDWLAGSVAVYGLMMLIKFVRYSSDQTFFRLLTPALILVTILATRAWSELAGRDLRWRRRLKVVAFLAVLAALAGSPVLVGPVLDYPNLISVEARGAGPDGVCLMERPKDLCGLPPEYAPVAAQFDEIVDRLNGVKAQGRTFVVVDENGSLFSLATGTAPFGRYPRIFWTAYTEERVEGIADYLRSHPPDYVLTRVPLSESDPDYRVWSSLGIGPVEDSPYGDLWLSLGRVIEDDYRLDSTLSSYQLWRRAG